MCFGSVSEPEKDNAEVERPSVGVDTVDIEDNEEVNVEDMIDRGFEDEEDENGDEDEVGRDGFENDTAEEPIFVGNFVIGDVAQGFFDIDDVLVLVVEAEWDVDDRKRDDEGGGGVVCTVDAGDLDDANPVENVEEDVVGLE